MSGLQVPDALTSRAAGRVSTLKGNEFALYFQYGRLVREKSHADGIYIRNQMKRLRRFPQNSGLDKICAAALEMVRSGRTARLAAGLLH